MIFPPWDTKTVEELNAWQLDGKFHPFTCPDSPHEENPKQTLLATADGWICPSCDYEQFWAHDFMANPKHRVDLERMYAEVFGLGEGGGESIAR